MKWHNIFTLLVLSIFGNTLAGFAQDSTFLPNAISKFDAKPALEKVYVHLDKPNYGFGDTIWYKAYTVIGQKHQPSALSGVLYVELISPKDSLVSRQTIPLVSGIGWSDIPLPFNLKPGSYRLRAYTRWMRNFGPDAFDEQRVVVGGDLPVMAHSNAEKPDVQFFPEGGELVTGVRSKVAFKAIGGSGRGKDVHGAIIDDSGKMVADFSAQHLGMGVFALTPEPGRSYKARINLPGEASYTIDLPRALEQGYTLTVNNAEKDTIYLKISANEKALAADKDKIFYIIAQCYGKVYYTTLGKLENTSYASVISRNRFPEGIVQFTLFNESGEPLAERIIFNENPNDELKLTASSANQVYHTRDKVKLELTTKDSAKPVSGSFSVAVINESVVQPDENEESTILNKLLLTSELKGYIEKPNYYFTNKNDKTRSDLDLLMLTQGYCRYEWRQIINPTIQAPIATGTNNTAIQQYLPERNQELSGTLATAGGKPVPNGKVTLAITRQNIFADTTTDANGRFTFTSFQIVDTATVILRARKANNGSKVKITPLVPEYPQIVPAINNWTTQADSTRAGQQYRHYQQAQKDYQFKDGKTLNTVTIKGVRKPKQPELKFSSNLNGPGHANQIIMWNQLGDGCVDLTDCLQGKVLGVTFTGGKAISTRSAGKMAKYPYMRIIVDGVLLGPLASLNDLNANDIYSIEVLRSGAYLNIYGSDAALGALVITMKRGGEGTVYFTKASPDGIINFPYAGFYKAKTFYTPKYEAHINNASDLRSTVYWHPNIITDKDGKATMEFNNNDTKGTYRVVVEGIDDDGRIGRVVYRYNVE